MVTVSYICCAKEISTEGPICTEKGQKITIKGIKYTVEDVKERRVPWGYHFNIFLEDPDEKYRRLH